VNKPLCLALAALIGLSACSAERVSLFPSYKLKVIQGNELDPRAVVSLLASPAAAPGVVDVNKGQLTEGTPAHAAKSGK